MGYNTTILGQERSTVGQGGVLESQGRGFETRLWEISPRLVIFAYFPFPLPAGPYACAHSFWPSILPFTPFQVLGLTPSLSLNSDPPPWPMFWFCFVFFRRHVLPSLAQPTRETARLTCPFENGFEMKSQSGKKFKWVDWFYVFEMVWSWLSYFWFCLWKRRKFEEITWCWPRFIKKVVLRILDLTGLS